VKQSRLQAITDSMRLVTESAIGKPIPNLNVLVQTPTAYYFLSSSSSSSGKITQDTWFRFASFTKNLTATAILNMHEDGWLDIDDRITDSMPGSAFSYVPNSSDWNIPYKNNITIRQLLSHTAGIYDSDNDSVPGLGGLSYTDYMLQSNPNTQFSTSQFVSQNTQY
jgi:D-alanyl-D-alanine carboxypeptidase